ncbi:carotenoid oxygenase [Scenedesmus sp. NREL 46B-D3]|nr:carotenoid oxygenase [Scenedesmus sp. NREL 46B-D3]
MLCSKHIPYSRPATARHQGCRSRLRLTPTATLLQGPPAQQKAPPSEVNSTPYRVTDSTIADINGLHKSLLHEYDYLVQDAWVEGSIPKDLRGTYFRNGPGLQVSNERYKRHTFDGDGMVLSFSFDQGRAWFKNKFVRTKGFVDEQAAGRPVHRTAFTRGAADGSLLFNPFDFTLKNVANTGVVHWGGRLLALYESGLPHELDAATLDTLGESTINGQLATPVLAAHYRVMPGQQQKQQQQQDWRSDSNGSSQNSSNGAAAGRTWVGFSFNAGLGDAELKFYEFAEEGQLAVPPQPYRLPGVSVAMIHDIAVTPDYYVVIAGPVNFDAPKFVSQYLTSRCSIAECLVYDPSKPTKVHLVPRPNGAAAGTAAYIMDAPAMFTFHHVNAFTTTAPSNSSSNGDGNGNGGRPKQQLVLDTVAWDEVAFENNQHNLTPAYYTGGARSHLRRLVFDLHPPQPAAPRPTSSSSAAASYSTGQLVGDHKLARRCVEFPCVNWDVHGEAHKHIYAVADRVDHEYHWGPTQVIMKLSLNDPLAGTQGPLQQARDVRPQLWDAGSRRLIMEPLFIPRSNPTAEDDGWVLATVHNAATGKGELVILDAQNIPAGPVATIHLQHFLPAGLHGSFDPHMVVPELQQQAAGGEGQVSAVPAWREPNVVRAL